MLDDRPMMIMTIFNDQFCFAQKRPKNAKMWKCKILDTLSMTFWLRTKFLGPAKIQNWTPSSVLEIQNSWLLVVEGAAEPCRLILLISDHPIQQGYYKFWNQLFSGTPCRVRQKCPKCIELFNTQLDSLSSVAPWNVRTLSGSRRWTTRNGF